jgi:hypothetical protein
MEPRRRSVLDTLLEPVIGLAEGETRWRGMTAEEPLAFRPFWPQIGTGRLAVDEPLANRVRSGRKQP